MTDIISSYINTAIQNHTDLLVSNSILSSSTSTLTEGTNYFTITLELTTISGIEVYLFKFTNTEEFSSDKFSSFNLLITDSNNETVINAIMGYSDNQFTVNSTGTGVMAGIITSSGFYCGKLRANLTIKQFLISITASDENVL